MGKKEINEEKQKVVALFNEGYWWDEIEEMTGIGANKVKMYLSIENISFRPIPVSQKWKEDFAFKWNRACLRFKIQGRRKK